jgi:PAS domain-containing protein
VSPYRRASARSDRNRPSRRWQDASHPVRSRNAADRAGPLHHRQFQQVFPLAAEHFVGVGQHPRRHHAEHRHFKALTQSADRRAFAPETVPAAVRRTVESLNLPAYVTGRRWDLLAWNAAADELFGFSRLPEAERNVLLCVLTNRATRRLFGASWADEARRMVAQFRATHDLWAGDPAFQDLLARLREGCPEFQGWWEAHDIRGVAAGQKSLSHPRKGRLKLEYASFQANDDPALKLVIYTPA